MLFGELGLEQQKRQGQADSSHVSAQIRWQISSLRGASEEKMSETGQDSRKDREPGGSGPGRRPHHIFAA